MPLVNVGLRHLIVFVEKCLKTPKLFLYYPLNITSMLSMDILAGRVETGP